MIPPLVPSLPPAQGRIRERLEDFEVEEVPLYPASGTGTHLFFLIEKRGLSTFEAVRRFARALGRREAEFGFAGLKDVRAVTRQWLSLEHVDEAAVRAVSVPGIRVLAVTRHGNKLKPGHLSGNRFRVRVRGGGPGDLEVARRILETLRSRGLPNAYGAQRFGRDGTTALMGRSLLRGEHGELLRLLLGEPRPGDSPRLCAARERMAAGDLAGAAAVVPASEEMSHRALRAAAQRGSAESGVRALPKRFLNLLVSAVQSDLFNRVLAARTESFDRVLDGDVAFVHERGACFVVTDAAAESPRAASFEISPSGPMFGTKTLMGAGAPRAIEEAVLAESALTPEDFGRVPGLRQKGARRPLRVKLEAPSVTGEEGAIVLSFELPAGSYATVVLEQVLRREPEELRAPEPGE